MSIGYIYVMSNRKMPGLLKVGFTCGSVDKRRRELSGATGVPEEFLIEYFQLTEEAEETEARIHADLATCRLADSREFFVAELSTVIEAIQRHTREPPVRFEKKNDVACRRCGKQYLKAGPEELCPACGF